MSPVVGFAIGGLAPVVLLASVFWYRDASGWIRRLFCALSLIGLSWAVFGIVRVYHLVQFTRAEWLVAQRVETLLAGLALGLLVAAFLSSDFWQVARHYRYWYGLTNRSSEPPPAPRPHFKNE